MMLFLLSLVLAALALGLAIGFPEKAQNCLTVVCQMLKRGLNSIERGCRTSLVNSYHWASSQGVPNPKRLVIGLLILSLSGMLVWAMYDLMLMRIQYVLPDAGAHTVLVLCILPSSLGVLIHFIQGKFRRITSIVLALLVLVLCIIAFLHVYEEMQMLEEDDLFRPILSALLAILMALGEFVSMWGSLQLLGPAPAYLVLLVIAPVALVWTIAKFCIQIQMWELVNQLGSKLIDVCGQIHEFPERWKKWKFDNEIKDQDRFLGKAEDMKKYERVSFRHWMLVQAISTRKEMVQNLNRQSASIQRSILGKLKFWAGVIAFFTASRHVKDLIQIIRDQIERKIRRASAEHQTVDVSGNGQASSFNAEERVKS